MKIINSTNVSIASIIVGERLRPVDEPFVADLAASIEAEGLQHPVLLMKIGNELRLVAGAHRLAASKLLGRTEILANICEPESDDAEAELRLNQVIENVMRRDLSALDSCCFKAELLATYKKLHGERRGGDRKSGSKPEKVRFWSTAAEVAKKLQLSASSVEKDAAIWSNLSAGSRQRLRGTKFAEARSQLKDLAALTPDHQSRVLDLLLADAPKVTTVFDAHAVVELRAAPDKPDPDDERYKKLHKLWLGASKSCKARFVAWMRKEGYDVTYARGVEKPEKKNKSSKKVKT